MLGLYLIFRNQKVDTIEEKETTNNSPEEKEENNKDEEKKKIESKRKQNLFFEMILSLISLSPFILFYLFINVYLAGKDLAFYNYGAYGIYFLCFIIPICLIPGIITAIVAFYRTFKKVQKSKENDLSIYQAIISFFLSTTCILFWLFMLYLEIPMIPRYLSWI